MPVDLNDPETVRRASARMQGPPPGWYPGHPDDPASYPENYSPHQRHLVRRIGDPWPPPPPPTTAAPPPTSPWMMMMPPPQATTPFPSHRAPPTSVPSANNPSRLGYSSASRRPPALGGLSHPNSGRMPRHLMLNTGSHTTYYSPSSQWPQSDAESDVMYIDDASLVTFTSRSVAATDLNGRPRPTSARGGAYVDPRAGSIAPTSSRAGPHRSRRAGSITPSPFMLRGPESDAGSMWSGGGVSVAPSDSASRVHASPRGSSRHHAVDPYAHTTRWGAAADTTNTRPPSRFPRTQR